MPSDQQIGLIAEDVLPHIPEIVGEGRFKNPDEPEFTDLTLSSGTLIFALINAVKELSAQVEVLKAAQ